MVRGLGLRGVFFVLALAGCAGEAVESAARDSGVPELDAGDVVDLGAIRTPLVVDLGVLPPESEREVVEQEPVPARAIFVDESPLRLGALHDAAIDTLGPICATGAEVLRANGSASLSSWSESGGLARTSLGLGSRPDALRLPQPAALARHLEALQSSEGALAAQLDVSVSWGAADLTEIAWSDDPDCGDRVVYQLRLAKRRLTHIQIAFASASDSEAFVREHGSSMLALFSASDAERAAIERDLAEVATIQIFHFQIGGDRASTEALLAAHRCSVTELAACAELIDDLAALAGALAEEPAPEVGNYHGWVPVQALAHELR